jgi:hypothetical protein
MGGSICGSMSKPRHDQVEVRLRELAQLFNSMDPSPFSDRDLDSAAEEFIVGWARELPHKDELELVIHLATPPDPIRAAGAEEAVRHYFADRAEVKNRELRLLLRRGRVSLAVGLLFLAGCFAASEIVGAGAAESWREFVNLGLQIAGWVAMWRPLEIFLYDWWPIRSDRLLMERLSRMRVRLAPPAA